MSMARNERNCRPMSEQDKGSEYSDMSSRAQPWANTTCNTFFHNLGQTQPATHFSTTLGKHNLQHIFPQPWANTTCNTFFHNLGQTQLITPPTNAPPQHLAAPNVHHSNTHTNNATPPQKKCLNCNQQHQTLAATCSYRKQVIHQKNENKTKQETEKNIRTYLDIAKTAIQQTNQPTPALTLSSNTHIKLVALVIEAHIASLAKTKSYGTILSKSLKRNFNIDTSFPDRDSQKIFNLFINPTPDPEPVPIATPNTNTETISTHQDMESEQSSTETNNTQDQNSDNTEPEQPWETRTKKKKHKKRKKACSPRDKHPSPDTYELEDTLFKSATQHSPIPTHPTNDWIITELAKTNPKIKVEIGKGDPNEVWKQIYVNKIHLNQLPIYAIPQQDFDEIPPSPKNLTHKRPKHTT
ncbi:hypothetical protein FHG87_020690 [Trinorchestia longiramus]|nr:hypothetical protein FHG87_020690 [Trinorchestia longiramus]